MGILFKLVQLSCKNRNIVPRRLLYTTTRLFKDYYKILGVQRSDSESTIKNAYYELAKLYHPDVNPNNPEASKNFAEISEAYEVLSDSRKRRDYESSTSKNSRKNWSYWSKSKPEDLYNDIFKDFSHDFDSEYATHPRQYVANISFLESIAGCSKTIEVMVNATCRRCFGKRAEPGTSVYRCPQCQGSGSVRFNQSGFHVMAECSTCKGSGFAVPKPCYECKGKGNTLQSRTIEIKIPSGVEDGQTLRAEVGNEEVFIVIQVAPSQKYRRQGFDVSSDVEISLSQAVLGGIMFVEGIYEQLSVRLQPCISSHDIIRLSGKGIRGKVHTGDHLIHIKIKSPSLLTSEQKALMLCFAETETSLGTVNGTTKTLDGTNKARQDIALVQKIKQLLVAFKTKEK